MDCCYGSLLIGERSGVRCLVWVKMFCLDDDAARSRKEVEKSLRVGLALHNSTPPSSQMSTFQRLVPSAHCKLTPTPFTNHQLAA